MSGQIYAISADVPTGGPAATLTLNNTGTFSAGAANWPRSVTGGTLAGVLPERIGRWEDRIYATLADVLLGAL